MACIRDKGQSSFTIHDKAGPAQALAIPIAIASGVIRRNAREAKEKRDRLNAAKRANQERKCHSQEEPPSQTMASPSGHGCALSLAQVFLQDLPRTEIVDWYALACGVFEMAEYIADDVRELKGKSPNTVIQEGVFELLSLGKELGGCDQAGSNEGSQE
jgi:hypothetical protein